MNLLIVGMESVLRQGKLVLTLWTMQYSLRLQFHFDPLSLHGTSNVIRKLSLVKLKFFMWGP